MLIKDFDDRHGLPFPSTTQQTMIADVDTHEVDILPVMAMGCGTESGKKWSDVMLSEWKGSAEGG
jgi:hypothetical protein